MIIKMIMIKRLKYLMIGVGGDSGGVSRSGVDHESCMVRVRIRNKINIIFLQQPLVYVIMY